MPGPSPSPSTPRWGLPWTASPAAPRPLALSGSWPCVPVPPLGLVLTVTGHSCRSSWSRSESSGTLPSTMACRTSWRPWSGCCSRTPSWAISKLGSVPILCSDYPHPRRAPRKTILRELSGSRSWRPRRSVNQPEQEMDPPPGSLGSPASVRAALSRPKKHLQRGVPGLLSRWMNTPLLLHGPPCSPSPSCPLLCCPEAFCWSRAPEGGWKPEAGRGAPEWGSAALALQSLASGRGAVLRSMPAACGPHPGDPG